MLEATAELQPLVVGALLIWAGCLKVFSAGSRQVAARSALSLLLRQTEAVHIIFRLLGCAELAIGLLALLPPHHPWEVLLAAGLGTMFVTYVLWALTRAPERPCGCLGGHEAPISWRTLVRGVVLVSVAAAGSTAHQFWLAALLDKPWLLSMAVLEGALLVRLSPELDRVWVAPPAFLRTRWGPSGKPDCATAVVPLPETEEQLRRSTAFKTLRQFLRSEALDYWRDGCWRFFSFKAEYDGRAATAVFAVPLHRRGASTLAAVLDEVENRVLLETSPTDTHGRDGARTRGPAPLLPSAGRGK